MRDVAWEILTNSRAKDAHEETLSVTKIGFRSATKLTIPSCSAPFSRNADPKPIPKELHMQSGCTTDPSQDLLKRVLLED